MSPPESHPRPLRPGSRTETRPRIVVVTAAGMRTFTPLQLERLRGAGDVAFHLRTGPIAARELGGLAERADVLAVTPRSVPRLDGRALDELPESVRAIAVFATGVDFVDLEAAERRGIAVAHLPDYSAISVAEHTIALLLTLSRRVHLARDRVLGRVPAGTSLRGWEAYGKTMGVVGAGRIGTRVVPLAEALGMRVLVADPRHGGDELENVLAAADVVSLHVPLVHGAPPLLGSGEIATMRRGAYLLNVSRSGLVDEHAVVDAVASGHLAGYAVDDRIHDRTRAARLAAEGRILETGHTAWYSDEAIERGVDCWVENVVALAAGSPRNLVAAPRALVAGA